MYGRNKCKEHFDQDTFLRHNVEDNTEMELMERCGDVNEIESFVMQQ
jgi:hypothetical protein